MRSKDKETASIFFLTVIIVSFCNGWGSFKALFWISREKRKQKSVVIVLKSCVIFFTDYVLYVNKKDSIEFHYNRISFLLSFLARYSKEYFKGPAAATKTDNIRGSVFYWVILLTLIVLKTLTNIKDSYSVLNPEKCCDFLGHAGIAASKVYHGSTWVCWPRKRTQIEPPYLKVLLELKRKCHWYLVPAYCLTCSGPIQMFI